VLVPLVVSRTIFLLGTVRTGRSAPPRLSGLYRDGHLGRVDLEPLPRDELADLLANVLDGPVVDTAVDELSRLSGGNLQVLAELVGAARQRGALVLGDTGWDLRGPLPTSAALEELVAEHVAAADADGRAVLELL